MKHKNDKRHTERFIKFSIPDMERMSTGKNVKLIICLILPEIFIFITLCPMSGKILNNHYNK